MSFSNTHFVHILWCRSPAWGLLDTALTSNVCPRVETIGGNNLRVNIWLTELAGQWKEAVGILGRYRVDSDTWLVGGKLPSSRGKVLWELKSLCSVFAKEGSSSELHLPSYISWAAGPPFSCLSVLRERQAEGDGTVIHSHLIFFLYLTWFVFKLTTKLRT